MKNALITERDLIWFGMFGLEYDMKALNKLVTIIIAERMEESVPKHSSLLLSPIFEPTSKARQQGRACFT